MGERPAEIDIVNTAAENRTGRAAVQTDAELATTPADDPEQIRMQIEQTRDEMSETIDAIQERLNPRNLVEQAKDSVREATVGKVKEMAHNVSDTASGMADTTMEAAGDLAERVKENPWPAVLLGLGAAWLLLRNGDGGSQHYARGVSAPPVPRYPRRTDGGVIQIVRENPVPAALAGIGVGMLAMKAREGSRSPYQAVPRTDWRRPSSYPATGYQTPSQQATGSSGQVGEQVADSYNRAKQTVSDAAERAQDAAGESFEAAQQKVSEFSSQARDYSADMLNRNPLLVGAAALLAGAAVGLSLPETESENQFMGEAREGLVERAQEAAHAAVDKVKNVAGDAAQSLGQ
jgi:ElaB/YqjD/DUF883 family membrane-anchored ribosome-binding protein